MRMTTDAYEIFTVKIFVSVCGAMTIKCTKKYLFCVSDRRYYNTRHSNVKLTARAERIPHSRNADWRSDLRIQKREEQL